MPNIFRHSLPGHMVLWPGQSSRNAKFNLI